MLSRILIAVTSVASVASIGCAAAKPHTFGTYGDLEPSVTAKAGERAEHVTINLSKAANVAVFLVVPGRASELLFPADSTQSGFLQAGSREVETTVAREPKPDSARLARRGTGQPPVTMGGDPSEPNGRARGAGMGGMDRGIGAQSMLTHGYLLVFASPDSMPYKALSTRVSGITIPIDDNDALNTVTKLIKSTTGASQWAAYATEYTP